MAWIIGGLLGLVCVWALVLLRVGYQKRLRLRIYAIYLMLHEETMSGHRKKLREIVRAAPDDVRAYLAVHELIESLSDRLADPDLQAVALSLVAQERGST